MIRPAPRPPERWLPLTAEGLAGVPGTEGVFVLYDAEKKVLGIRGAMDLSAALAEVLDDGGDAVFFTFEEDAMYTKRESELLQQYLQEHGELPGGGADDLDDLF